MADPIKQAVETDVAQAKAAVESKLSAFVKVAKPYAIGAVAGAVLALIAIHL
jgi:ammonia channel protein AmtB